MNFGWKEIVFVLFLIALTVGVVVGAILNERDGESDDWDERQ